MIDIHSHILPGVDDGARTETEALDMLKMAVDQGVTTQVLTPHIHLGRFNNTKAELTASFVKFRDLVDSQNIPIRLLLGAELRIGPELMTLVQQDQIPWLGEYQGKKAFLLEFPRIDVPHGSDNLVRWLLQKNIQPIIVHPERNKTFINNPAKLQTFIDLGCPLQVTASSLTGKFGEEAQDMAIRLIENEQVLAIASDCHNLKGRAPDLLDGVKEAQTIIGETNSKYLVNRNPNEVVKHLHCLA
ncbi:CpsB/CapC family capsule biosynthesis tyrosine phosphatase [uncultured Paraglaciecola sp.]|uniref:tyrosine-protein phosphatase n=1 Tax=uncultured Paraglaciecola sp. TaxID=1765024 RepID=UPI0030DAB7BF|tara:strand:+ start:7857 stop:8588 length:732 start_codon:yes stop_codon:yes gene_type:complete